MSGSYICLRCRISIKLRTRQLVKGSAVQSRTFISLSRVVRNDEEVRKDGALNDTSRPPRRKTSGRLQKRVQSPTNKLLEGLFVSTQREIPVLPTESESSTTWNPTFPQSGRWHSLIWRLITTMNDQGYELHGKAPMGLSHHILENILDVWRIYVYPSSSSLKSINMRDVALKKALEISTLGGNALSNREQDIDDSHWPEHPSTNEIEANCAFLLTDLENRPGEIFPRYQTHTITRRVTVAAALTYLYLVHMDKTIKSETFKTNDYQWFTPFVAALIKGSNMDRSMLQDCLVEESVSPPILKRILTQWKELEKLIKKGFPEQQQEFICPPSDLGSNAQVRSQEQGSAAPKPKTPTLQSGLRHEDRLSPPVSTHISDQRKDLEKTVLIESPVQQHKTACSSGESRSNTQVRQVQGNAAPRPRTSKLLSDLRNAVRKCDIKSAMKLWGHLQQQMDIGQKDEDAQSEIFAGFLLAFFTLGQPQRAIEVWNTMKRVGSEPTRKHWIAVLDGCRKARDLTSLQSVWQTMRASNTQADNETWEAYISGLLHCKEWSMALKALEELAVAWKTSTTYAGARSGKSPSGTIGRLENTQPVLLQPSIEPVNVTMSGLVALTKVDVAKRVLKWAISQNLKPDIKTFNILIRPAVRKGQTKEVQRVLQESQAHNCEPDIVTFNILLDGLFRNPSSSFVNQNPDDQRNAVFKIFQDMEDCGIKPNAHTYSTLLDSLLSPKSFNLAAARAVLSRMTEKNIRPSPHIYTILITHYFSTKPPDIPAIESLWRRIKAEKTPMDHVFYDRMIEGYGRVGEMEKMLGLLRRMPQEGKTPGWYALLEALRALVQYEEWGMVYDLIRDVTDENGFLKNGARGWRGEEEFWVLVDALRRKGIELPEKLAGQEKERQK